MTESPRCPPRCSAGNKLKTWGRIATRYDKAKESYLGFVSLTSTLLWILFVHEIQPDIGLGSTIISTESSAPATL